MGIALVANIERGWISAGSASSLEGVVAVPSSVTVCLLAQEFEAISLPPLKLPFINSHSPHPFSLS